MQPSQVRVPAAPLHVTTLGKVVYTHVPLFTKQYKRKLEAKQAFHATCSFGWCLAEGYVNGDQRRPMGY